MRVVDADQVHLAFAGGLVGGQKVFGAKLVACGLRAFEGVLQGDGVDHDFGFAVGGTQHGAAALIRIARLGVGHHGGPGRGLDTDHSSSQKCSLRYFSALSQSTVTMVAVSPSSAISRARSVAAWTLQPEEMP